MRVSYQHPRLHYIRTNMQAQLLQKAFVLHRTLPLTPDFLEEAVQSPQTTYVDIIVTVFITNKN